MFQLSSRVDDVRAALAQFVAGRPRVRPAPGALLQRRRADGDLYLRACKTVSQAQADMKRKTPRTVYLEGVFVLPGGRRLVHAAVAQADTRHAEQRLEGVLWRTEWTDEKRTTKRMEEKEGARRETYLRARAGR